jgi:hypothetical protein
MISHPLKLRQATTALTAIIRRASRATVRTGGQILRSAPGLAGAACITYGSHLIYQPAAWFVAGAACIIAGWELNR